MATTLWPHERRHLIGVSANRGLRSSVLTPLPHSLLLIAIDLWDTQGSSYGIFPLKIDAETTGDGIYCAIDSGRQASFEQL